MDTNLPEILEALLFSSSEPLAVKTIQTVLSRAAELESQQAGEEAQGNFGEVVAQSSAIVPAARIREAMDELEAALLARGGVYEIAEGPEGWRMVLKARYSNYVRLLREEPLPRRLGASMMETLAVVAYRQPVTRSEIESIRGVACERALAKLAELDLVRVTGRADLPGRPMQYGTTPHFLEYCGITSLEELPGSDVISPQKLDEWLRSAERGAAPSGEPPAKPSPTDKVD